MSIISSRSLAILLGISACGLTGYLILSILKKDEDDDYFDTVSTTAHYRTIEIPVPNDVVRLLIGRNGKNIRQFQEQSNAKINFRDVDDDKRICVIKGSHVACNVAESLIRDFIANQPLLESEDIWVPHGCVGKIIGRNGDRIKEISAISGAKVNVSDERNDSSCRITIKGIKPQISLAKSLIEDIVQQLGNAQVRLDMALSKREPRIPPKSPDSPKSSPGTPRSERISPFPGQSDAQFEVYVSAMVDPSHFWLQIVSPKATELDQLVEEMTEYYSRESNRENHILDKIEKGDLVAAVFQYDSKWYRAEVLNVFEENPTEPKAELYYVDYGDTDVVPCNELFELRTDFLRLHFQAIECYLAKVEPVDGTWTDEAIDKFEEWTHVAQWKKLSAKMNGYSIREKTRAKREGSPVPGVELFDVCNEQDINIAQELVSHGFAVFKKKSEDCSSSPGSTRSSPS